MKYLWPEEYKKLEQAMIPYQEERMRTLNKAMEEIEKALKEAGIELRFPAAPSTFTAYTKRPYASRRP